MSLRHFFPEHWDGHSDSYSIAQHIDDVIDFIEKLDAGPVDLMGHSRGGHVSFRVAQRRPDLLRKLILAEPGGETRRHARSRDKAGGPSPLRGALRSRGRKDRGRRHRWRASRFSWTRSKARAAGSGCRQLAKQLLRDNAMTLIGQVRDNRPPFSKDRCRGDPDPTLFIGGADTKGMLPKVLHTLAAHVTGSQIAMIPGTTHPMFEQAPQKYCEIVLGFLAE